MVTNKSDSPTVMAARESSPSFRNFSLLLSKLSSDGVSLAASVITVGSTVDFCVSLSLLSIVLNGCNLRVGVMVMAPICPELEALRRWVDATSVGVTSLEYSVTAGGTPESVATDVGSKDGCATERNVTFYKTRGKPWSSFILRSLTTTYCSIKHWCYLQ